MTNLHRDKAVATISAVKAMATALRDQYDQPQHDRATIADLNAEISRGLKIAEIEATLAIAEAIEARERPPGIRMQAEAFEDHSADLPVHLGGRIKL